MTLVLLACLMVASSQRAEIAQAQAENEVSSVAAAPDKGMEGFPEKYPRPVSQWQESEKARYQKLLAAGKFDVIVVPFQVQNDGFHRSINSLMAARMAGAIGKSGKVRVADPYLTARALGEGQRRLDPEEVYRLANLTGAKRIIWGYAGHGGGSGLSLFIQWQDKPQKGPFDSTAQMHHRRVNSDHFSDRNSVLDIYESALPELLQGLSVD